MFPDGLLEREQARLSRTAKEQAHAALTQLRARLGFSLVVIWIGSAAPLAFLYFFLDGTPRGDIFLQRLSLLTVSMQSLILPTVIFLAMLPQYLSWKPDIKVNLSFSNCTLLGISSYTVTILLLSMTHNTIIFMADLPFPYSVIRSLQSPVYTICIAILIDLHVNGGRGMRWNNRVYDGAILGTMAAVSQFIQMILLSFFAFPHSYLFVMISLSVGLVVGAFIPVSTAATFARAQNTRRSAV
jgi:hypothetical protein